MALTITGKRQANRGIEKEKSQIGKKNPINNGMQYTVFHQI